MSELILIDDRKVDLPAARNRLAEAVRPHVGKLVKMLPAQRDRVQFAAAVVVACNELDAKRVTDIKSVLSSSIGAVRMGLMPGSEMGLAYFVPFKGRVQLIPGYKGYIYLATQNNYLRWVATEVVYRGEEFRQWHDERGPHISHEIPLERCHDDREILAAYCTYQTRLADMAVPVVIDRATIDKAKGASQTDKVWRPHFAEMAMKTAIRRAAKRWNVTQALSKAIHYDELAERGEFQPVETLDGVEVEGAPVRRLSDLGTPAEPVEPEGEPEKNSVFASLLADARKITDATSDEATALEVDISAELDAGTITADQAAELRGIIRNAIPFGGDE